MKKTTEVLEQEYLAALKEVHLILQHSKRLNIKKVTDKYNLKYATTFGKTLKHGGIIKKTDKGYEWTTVEPTLAMAKEALRRNAERERNARRTTPPAKTEIKVPTTAITPNNVTKVTETPKYYVLKIGFLKFRITPVYK